MRRAAAFFWACILFSVGTGVFACNAVDWSSAVRVDDGITHTSISITDPQTSDILATVTALARTALVPKQAATPTIVPPMAAGGINLDGASYRVNAIADPEPAGFFKPAAGKRTVALNVTVTAGDKTLAYGFTQFRLIDAQAKEYTWALGNNEPKFEQGTLQPGQSKSGWMAFAVPADVKPVAVLVQPTGAGPKVAVSALP
ncbi:MAG: DUF4352 domain-containing protein [Anaerolineaceae bacterium]